MDSSSVLLHRKSGDVSVAGVTPRDEAESSPTRQEPGPVTALAGTFAQPARDRTPLRRSGGSAPRDITAVHELAEVCARSTAAVHRGDAASSRCIPWTSRYIEPRAPVHRSGSLGRSGTAPGLCRNVPELRGRAPGRWLVGLERFFIVPGRRLDIPENSTRAPGHRRNTQGLCWNAPGCRRTGPGAMSRSPGPSRKRPGTSPRRSGTLSRLTGAFTRMPGVMPHRPGTMRSHPGA